MTYDESSHSQALAEVTTQNITTSYSGFVISDGSLLYFKLFCLAKLDNLG
jgi:hypothetical protein